ncbi:MULTISPECIES: hypothetical protein [unclassified Streptomyces]|uniref:hypothetical protein n=1 Tax=unclassified Streptomyces TaxID=2593676 RepID=UPI002DDABF15|nr:hypothetical protein [Streptomyces sp. NBC_01445]WSE05556.1 hypothetical protein OG574_20630 [Streptomyces sp. NBC_01445]
MRTVRRLAALAVALTAALAALLLSASGASAGGPTSVLVVSPESGQSASLYFSDKRYGPLETLLGEPGQGRREEPPGLGIGVGRQLNVTWLVHDVLPWRVDRVYPDSPGTKDVWIHTATHVPDSYNGYWHKAQKPAELRALLKDLGVMGERSQKGGSPIFPAPWQSPDRSKEALGGAPAPAADSRDAGQSAGARASASRAGEGTDWWWAIPGLAAGAALALVMRPLAGRLPRRRGTGETPPDTGPRQQLIDS